MLLQESNKKGSICLMAKDAWWWFDFLPCLELARNEGDVEGILVRGVLYARSRLSHALVVFIVDSAFVLYALGFSLGEYSFWESFYCLVYCEKEKFVIWL